MAFEGSTFLALSPSIVWGQGVHPFWSMQQQGAILEAKLGSYWIVILGFQPLELWKIDFYYL
jgi:hypothetical protein